MPRLAIVNTHPIQYYSPYYRRLAKQEDIDLHVFYGWRGMVDEGYDPGFQQEVSWDIPLLEGYEHTFVENTASDPGTHHFRGIIAPDLIPEVERWDPDALLVFGWSYQSHLRALRHFHGQITVLFRGDSTLLDETPGPHTWMRRVFLRWIYRYVDVALYVGKNNRAYFEAHGIENDALVWIPHAINNERFATAPNAERKAEQWRDELGIPAGAPVVLFAGKLEPKKAPDLLLRAFRKLEVSEAHLVLVGSGSREKDLRKQAEDLSRVHFLGFQNQSRMPVVYRLGDLFALPSRGPGETWGLGVNEAMACGRPVLVTSNVGCAPDLVDEANGAVVTPDDAKALRTALDTLLADQNRLQEMGRRSAERIRQWSIEDAAARTADAVREVLSPSERGYRDTT